MAGLNGWHLVIILAIVLLLFGAPRLPALARSLGQSMKIFKSEIKTPEDEKRAEAARNESAQDSHRSDAGTPPSDSPWERSGPSGSSPRTDSASSADTNPKP